MEKTVSRAVALRALKIGVGTLDNLVESGRIRAYSNPFNDRLRYSSDQIAAFKKEICTEVIHLAPPRNQPRSPYIRLMDLIDTIGDFGDREEAKKLVPHVVIELAYKWIQEHKSICLCYGSSDKICEQKHKD